MKDKKQNSKFYLVGGGIASLASAVFLIRDGKARGENITILEAGKEIGGSLDAGKSSSRKGYVTRGHRILEAKTYACTFELLASIPSLATPRKNIKQEILEFNRKHKTHNKARLIAHGKKLQAASFGLSWKDRFALLRILLLRESSLETLCIQDYFSPEFFQTNFWFEFCTVFAFQPWDSLVEFRRYTLRAFHALPFFENLDCILVAPYHQHDSIILPIIKFLQKEGVNFQKNCKVNALDFTKINNKKSATSITCTQKGKTKKISVSKNDFVFVTLGSMVANSSIGSMHSSPPSPAKSKSVDWKFWEKLAKQSRDFGKPQVFDNNKSKSSWESFTLTLRDSRFFDLMEKLTNNKRGSGGGSTLKDSNWLLSIALPHQPHFLHQPKNVDVAWGYALYPSRKGNFIKKKMSECSGAEILQELCCHLGFQKDLAKILKSAICIPCMLPYITSQFTPHKKNNRAKIIPRGYSNLACIGQFCEIPKEIVFTIEYSIRSAQIGVNSLLNLKREIPPIYEGYRYPKAIYNAVKTVLR
ncbi:oleate hydratase [Candidatus Gracilibacteria bacterium]|nr:oleate hydratase [Candidatus Gracilibacteria bacterium]MCF7856427.1 oleate hydratase [Candidatus Gracilibacteria bacterium]MCF7896300.1 oleate hydratase [Candidatus Gracilibacteria bacterium]